MMVVVIGGDGLLTKVVMTMIMMVTRSMTTSMLSIIAITNRPLPPRLCSFAPCGNFGKCEEHDGTFSCHCFKVIFLLFLFYLVKLCNI